MANGQEFPVSNLSNGDDTNVDERNKEKQYLRLGRMHINLNMKTGPAALRLCYRQWILIPPRVDVFSKMI